MLSSDAGKGAGHTNDVSGGLQCLRTDRGIASLTIRGLSAYTSMFFTACPFNFIRFNNICVHFGGYPRPYDNSNKFCKAIGGQLYEPRCEDTDAKVRAFAQEMMDFRTGKNVPARGPWMGITDNQKEGRLVSSIIL